MELGRLGLEPSKIRQILGFFGPDAYGVPLLVPHLFALTLGACVRFKMGPLHPVLSRIKVSQQVLEIF
jgi:hypothetical protein